MNKGIAVVTGASSGFGLLTTIELAKRNFHVIATMRNLEKGETLLQLGKQNGVEKQISLLELDVTSESSINHFKNYINELGSVDVLINNAGFAGAGFVEEIPLDEYRKQFETNFFGLIAVTQACLPFMREKQKGKIINISSISGRVGFPGISPYVASKHAVEGFSECLRLEMKPFGVEVILIEPGSYKTNIWSTGKQVTEKSLNPNSPYFTYMRKIEEQLEKGEHNFGNPLDVANRIVQLAEEEKTSLRHPIGKGIKTAIFMKNLIPWRMWEKLFFKKLG
ncbi:oxidoreductase [Bacillus sp. 31A1R]|uniref:Oxidoreductase n=1 Tax=Robertmurraya mangrovi TaxID=3098077 RepID=A0ABU5J3C7_9BACI|nr:oxidoreductase [Bacillus sp. 31A1R]MDZ5473876.1 oxidoreductase [Bacillus sp. 31A1R]